MSVTGLTICHTGEWFQCSNDTISKFFHKMLFVFSSGLFYANMPPLQKIRCSHKMWPFFQHALRAIDGSHIPSTPPPTERTMYHNHKGFLSQNCLFACSFNLKFVFGYTGWEGSATDNQVWEVALECGLNIPGSRYFLADAGYADNPWLLLPYCGIQYHLAKWNWASQK